MNLKGCHHERYAGEARSELPLLEGRDGRVTKRSDPRKEQLFVGSSIAAALAAGLLVPLPAWGQAGWYVTPSVSLSEAYDDNIFFAPSNQPAGTQTSQSKQGDFIFRGTPGLNAGYKSGPFTLLGGYAVSGEVYAHNSDLNTIPAEQNATLETRYRPDPLLLLSFLGGYLQSEEAQQLNSPAVEAQTGVPATALQGQRARSSLYYLGPTATYQIDQLTSVSDGYDFSHTQQVGATSSDTHTVSASFDRRITERDMGDLAYTFQRFSFTQPAPPATTTPEAGTPPPPQPDDVTNSHVFTVGWTRELTSLTRIVLRGGPRFTEGSVFPEAFGSISHKLTRGLLEFSYARTQTTAIGQTGTVNTQSFTGTANYQPLREMVTSVGLFLYQNSQSGSPDSDVYGAGSTVRYRISQWVSLFGSYQFTYQHGILNSSTGPTSSQGDNIYHNVVLIGLEASQPYRSY